MTPEQLKLMKQLAQLGDVTIVNGVVTNLVNAISGMDIKALKLILEDNISYQETQEWINWANDKADWLDPLINKPDDIVPTIN